MLCFRRAATVAVVLLLTALAARSVLPTSPGPRIADLNVLLPPRMTHAVEYRLHGSDGCFSWSWDHHDILSVQPEYNITSRCSTSARLISISPYNGRKETAVYATDLHTGITIRCKVIVDMISRIQIFHHAVKIDLDELATLRILSFDSEDNVFSSLVGLQFFWKLVPQSLDDDSINHLVHVPLKETPLSDFGGFYGDLDVQIDLENKGVGSDLYVVKGAAIGHEVVSAQLLEPQLEHVMDEIVLTVAEAISLDPPSPVFITLGALLHYTLRVIRLKTAKVIGLPSPHHKWYATNLSVARVDSMTGVTHALNLGSTDIVVEDTRVSDHFQISSVHVVIPDKLCLYLVPVTDGSIPLKGVTPISSSDVWYVFPGQEYIISIKVFSKGSDANEILVTENNDLRLESNTSKYWDLYPVSKDITLMYNWQWPRLLKPISQGKGALTAALSYQSENLEMLEVLSVVQEVNVCSKVRLIFGEHDYDFEDIHLPWTPGIEQEHELKAIGGCGINREDYKWLSSNEAIVSTSGFGSIQAKNPGKAIIKVASVFDSANYDEVVIEVSVPSSIVMLPIFPVEVAIGTQLQAAVTLHTSNGHYFSRCDAFRSFIRWKVFSESGSFQVLNTTDLWAPGIFPIIDGPNLQYGYPCAWVSLFASGVGQAVLHAILSFESVYSLQSFDGITTLKTVLHIASYYPLTAYQAGNGNQFGGYWVNLHERDANIVDFDSKGLDELILLPGSTMDVLLLGGPERWDQKVEFIETVKVLGEHNLSVVHLHEYHSGRRLYRIFCQTYGKFKLIFSRGNLVGDDHPKPTIASLELSVICDFPSLMVLIANEPANTFDAIYAAKNADRDHVGIRVSPIIVSNGCIIRIAAVSIHATGRAFANSSSLSLRWELSGCEYLAFWNDTDTAAQFDGAKWERFLVLQNASGLCIVRATAMGLSEKVTSHLYDENYSMLEPVQTILMDALPLQLVSSLRVLPDSVLMVFDPEAKVNLSITGGTCSLDAYINDTQVADIVLPPESTECSHFIVGAKGLGVALVIVRDNGLSPPASASALVKVASVDWIKIISPGEISLMEGTTKSFGFLAGTEDGNIFDSSQYIYMKIKVHLEDGILEPVTEYHTSRTENWLLREPNFSIKAAKLGITALYVSVCQKSGHEIVSQVVKVEVYRPLRLHPEYLFLLPGVSYVLTVKDGPRNGAFIQFTSLHEEIAIFHKSSGKIFANSIGNATIQVAVYGNGGALICQAYGKVEVGVPQAMVLDMQSDQLCVGCNMPVLPSFPEGDLFSFYEVCQDYKWSIGNEKVLSFQISDSGEQEGHPFYSVGSDIMKTVIGRSTGKTEVSILLSCDIVLSGSPQQVYYSALKSLEVVSNPPVGLGIPITWILPPFYTSSELLPRFSNSYEQLDSHRRVTYSIMRVCGKIDNLKQGHITIDGGKIRTKESKDLACVQAKDGVSGRTDIACCVRVAEVSQVRITATGDSSHVAHLDLNSKLELNFGYTDYLGYPFVEAHGVVPLDVETNRPDVLTIFVSSKDHNNTDGNEHIILEAKNPGSALVRISINNNPRKADFMLVSVGAQLHPRNPVLHIGQYLNFTIVGDGIDVLHSGKWLSGNGSVLTINSITGEGYAHGEGATQVIFVGSNLKLQTTVAVMKVDQIVVDAPAETLTNVLFPSKGYMFSVKFSEPLNYQLEAIGSRNDVPFDCRVDPPFVGYAKAWINNVTGYSCLFFPYSPKHLLSVMMKSNMKQKENANSAGLVYISIVASLRDAPDIMGSAHAPYVGGFILDTEKINLTSNANSSLFMIIGNTDVDISWNSKELLSVTPVSIVSFGVAGIREYEVKILKSQPFKDTIRIVLPPTGQRTEIDVSFESGERTAASGSSSITWTAVIACAIVLVLTVLVFMRLLERPNRSGLSRHPAPTSAVPRPAMTDLTSTGNVELSPHTPQPLMDYVRRTLDETPYYKREGRRRFDPQYTY